ncbi:MAG: NUDIX hydrolase [Thermodesulfobacteriota bacterium]
MNLGFSSPEAVAAVKPADAATVILLRETEAGPFEVFLMRRHGRQSFMANAFVFPGGRLDQADCDPALISLADGLSAEKARLDFNEPDLEPAKALGLYFTAIRETFEEAGLLLAGWSMGRPVSFTGETAGRYAAYRKGLQTGELTLKEIALKEGLRFDLSRLQPYSHWITPEVEKKRFDTRFLLARLPREQTPVHDSMEMTESVWLAPREAVDRHYGGALLLMPPTIKTLEELSSFQTIEEVLAAAANRTILPILPRASITGETIILKLPYDPEYDLEEYKQPPRLQDKTRLYLAGGRWRTAYFGDSV